MFFCRSIYIETAQNSREECNEFADLFVLKTIIVPFKSLFPDDTRSLDLVFYSSLYFYTSDTFRPILAHFTHFTLHQFFLTHITTRKVLTFLIPDDAVARDLIIVYNISSQRPHLNYLFLSNVYSFDTI